MVLLATSSSAAFCRRPPTRGCRGPCGRRSRTAGLAWICFILSAFIQESCSTRGIGALFSRFLRAARAAHLPPVLACILVYASRIPTTVRTSVWRWCSRQLRGRLRVQCRTARRFLVAGVESTSTCCAAAGAFLKRSWLSYHARSGVFSPSCGLCAPGGHGRGIPDHPYSSSASTGCVGRDPRDVVRSKFYSGSMLEARRTLATLHRHDRGGSRSVNADQIGASSALRYSRRNSCLRADGAGLAYRPTPSRGPAHAVRGSRDLSYCIYLTHRRVRHVHRLAPGM